MNLGTHMPGGERRKPIDIEDRRTKVKVTTSKNRTKICRLSPFTIRHMCTKFHLDPTFCSYDIVRKRKKYQIFVLFLEVVTLTFVLRSSIMKTTFVHLNSPVIVCFSTNKYGCYDFTESVGYGNHILLLLIRLQY
jgi:hypothetical protein